LIISPEEKVVYLSGKGQGWRVALAASLDVLEVVLIDPGADASETCRQAAMNLADVIVVFACAGDEIFDDARCIAWNSATGADWEPSLQSFVSKLWPMLL
jgi:MinD-like ATPase involved in chromosome partitioning or flagellar assembly